MSSRNRYRNFYELVATVAIIVTLISKFIKVVAEKDRLPEFFMSTAVLITVYYLMYHFLHNPETLILYIYPFLIYAVCWSIILGSPEKQKYNSEIHWADETWWWSLTGWDFEEEVAKVFRKHGYKATVTKKTGDNGADIIMYKNKKKIIVQCKHYTAQASPESVRALWGIKDEFKADEVILVASFGVSKQSLKFINKRAPLYTLYTLSDIINMAINKQ